MAKLRFRGIRKKENSYHEILLIEKLNYPKQISNKTIE